MVETVAAALADAQGRDVRVLDVRTLTDITDWMVIATGTSDRHLQTLADRVAEFMAAQGYRPLGTEGEDTRDWVLVDFVDVVVHVMREAVRRHYDLEGLWDPALAETAPRDGQAEAPT